MKKPIQYITAIIINWLSIGWLGLEAYNSFERAAIAALILIFSFAAIVFIYNIVQRNVKNYPIVGKIFYAPLTIFGIIDVVVNVNYSPILLIGHYAGKLKEDLTFTAHCKAIKVYTQNKVFKGEHVTRLEMARYWLCENVYGPIMNLIQKGHYS